MSRLVALARQLAQVWPFLTWASLRRDLAGLTRHAMTMRGASQHIHSQVTGWAGVTSLPHRFGGTEYRYGDKREIGHVHGDWLVDIPFPKKVRDEVVAAGRAEPHHILPQTGWVSLYLRRPGDVERAIELLRLSYELAVRKRGAGPTAIQEPRPPA
jgi:hypothetical protein